MKKSYLVGMQYLRAVACVGVALVHLVPKLDGGLPASDFNLRVLGIGTDTLLIISGFFTWVTTERLRTTPLRWWAHRILRLAPLYWLTLGVYLLIIWRGGGILPSLEHILRAFLFVPGGPSGNPPFFVPGWAMNLIFIFVLVYALALNFRRPALRLAAVGGMMLVMLSGRWLLRCDGPVLFVATSPMLLEFAAGLTIAAIRQPLAGVPRAWLLGVAALAAGVLYAATVSPELFPDGPRSLRNGVPAALFVFGILQLEPLLRRLPTQKLLKAVGDASYSVYLSHPLVVEPLGAALNSLGLPTVALNAALGLAVLLALGVAVYRLVERPLVGTTKRWLGGTGKPRATTEAA